MTAIPPETAYWSSDAAEVMRGMGSSVRGLSAAEAAERLRRHGANTVDGEPQLETAALLLHQFASPLVLILIFGAAISLLVRQWIDAAIILAIVLGSALLGFVQEYRAGTAVAALRRRLALTVQVLRDGAPQTVAASAIVPGDLVLLSAGNLVPADGVVLEANDFLVAEASLTGESFPVEKRPGILPPGTPLAGRTPNPGGDYPPYRTPIRS